MAPHDYRKRSVHKECTIDIGTISQTELGVPEELPTSAPGTPQYTFTVAEIHKPVIVGDQPYSYIMCAFPHICGINDSGGDAIVTATLKKNGTETVESASFSTISNNQYWNIHGLCFDVNVGDYFDYYVHSDVAGVHIKYEFGFVLPSRIIPDIDVDFIEVTNAQQPLDSDITIGSANDYSPYSNRYAFENGFVHLQSGDYNFGQRHFDEYGVCRLGSCDVNGADTFYRHITNTDNPSFRGNQMPSTLKWRESR